MKDLLKAIALAVVVWITLAFVRTVLILIGIPLSVLAVFFYQPQTSVKYPGRTIYNAPRWLWLWGNDADGMTGDSRGWWHENADQAMFFGLFPFLRRWFPNIPMFDSTHFISMWYWLALRNPVNNLRYVNLINCVPADYNITLLAGQEFVADKPGLGGFQFVQALPKVKRLPFFPLPVFGFYFVHEWSSTRAFVIRLGHKIEPRHADTTEPKGMVFKLNAYKSI